MAIPCPVCKAELRSAKSHGNRYFCECLRCGPYSLSATVNTGIQWYLSRGEDIAAKVSYALYRMTKREQWAMLTSDLMENIIHNTELPRPLEQLDNLILWLGEKQPTMGTAVAMADDAIAATGATDSISVGFLTSEAVEGGLISGIVKETLNKSQPG